MQIETGGVHIDGVSSKCGSLAAIILVIACYFGALTEVIADDLWPSRPYHVRVEVTGGSDALRVATRELVLDGLGAACVEREPADKSFHIAFHNGRNSAVRVFENDLWLHDQSEIVSERVESNELLAATAARLAQHVFRPRFRITRTDDKFLASIWGGRIDPAIMSVDTWLQPRTRFHDRDGEWRQTQNIAWTYLNCPALAALDQPIDVVSAYPRPLPGRLRRGMVIALPCPIVEQSTRIQLVDRDTGKARQGLRIEIIPAATVGSDSPTPSISMRTDRYGEILLDRDELRAAALTEHTPVVRIQAFTTHLLADIPLLVGSVRELRIPLAADQERVDFEERIAVIENELQDLVAQRAVLVAKIKADVEAEHWSAAENSLPKLDELPDSSGLFVSLNAARVIAVKAAEKRGDRTLAARIRRRAKRLETTLRDYANPEISDDLRDEIVALKEIQAAAEATRQPKTERIPQN